jgi:hypothetical protein
MLLPLAPRFRAHLPPSFCSPLGTTLAPFQRTWESMKMEGGFNCQGYRRLVPKALVLDIKIILTESGCQSSPFLGDKAEITGGALCAGLCKGAQWRGVSCFTSCKTRVFAVNTLGAGGQPSCRMDGSEPSDPLFHPPASVRGPNTTFTDKNNFSQFEHSGSLEHFILHRSNMRC